MTRQESATSGFDRLQRLALVVGALGLLALLLGLFTGVETFFQSYLYAFLFWLGASAGCLVLLMVQHLAGGPWGVLVRRPLEAGAMLLPLMALLFVPVLFGLPYLYEWTDAQVVAESPFLANKAPYLNTPFFIARAAIYFAIWIWYAFYFYRGSLRQDEGRDSLRLAHRMRRTSGPGLVVFIATMTFAAWDWGMSLEPEWFSGIYGAIIMIGQAITAVALVILVVTALARRNATLDTLLTAPRLQDLGNFLMAFTLFWAYVEFSQLIIQWSNNTVETSSWYVLRFDEGWRWLALFLLIFHFFAPFAILFSRWVKRKRRALVLVASWMLFARLVDLFFTIIPAYHRTGFPLHWLDIVAVIAMGGIWLAVYVSRLKRHPLLPQHDPRLDIATGQTRALNALGVEGVEHA